MVNQVKFKEDTHQYFDLKTEKELISVTTLLRKHGLAPNYGNVDPQVLKAKAERGKLIHLEIEKYIKYGEIGFTPELQYFIDYATKNALSFHKSEFIVFNDIVAGTIDLVAINVQDGYLFIDFKSTAARHEDSEAWQVSTYAYLYERCTPESIDPSRKKVRILHFGNNGLEVYDLPIIPDAEIDKLMECERNGTIYQREIVGISATQLAEVEEIEGIIAYHEALLKETKSRYAKLQDALMHAMKANGVKSHDFGKVKVTYTPPSTKQTLDQEKLFAEHPEINKEDYMKSSNVKEKLTITVRKEKVKND